MSEHISSELPFAFDPLETLVNPRIKDVAVSLPHPQRTGDKQHVVRWAWNPAMENSEPLATTVDALYYARMHREHLTALGEAGLAIPKYQSFIAKHPTRQDSLALYSSVEYIPVKHIAPAWHPKTCRYIGESLLRYIDWVEETKQDRFMGDVQDLLQYSLNPENPADRPYLIDIEPSFWPAQEADGQSTDYLLEFWLKADKLTNIQ